MNLLPGYRLFTVVALSRINILMTDASSHSPQLAPETQIEYTNNCLTYIIRTEFKFMVRVSPGQVEQTI